MRQPRSVIRIARAIVISCVLALLGHLYLHAQAPAPAAPKVLWYRSPAPIWDHALPVGNGRLGAMVFGGANRGPDNGDLQDARKNTALTDGNQTYGGDEHLQLNESSLWEGSRSNRLNPRSA